MKSPGERVYAFKFWHILLTLFQRDCWPTALPIWAICHSVFLLTTQCIIRFFNFSFDNSIDVFIFISLSISKGENHLLSFFQLFIKNLLTMYNMLCIVQGTENPNQIHTMCDSWNVLSTRGDRHETINYRNNYLSTVVMGYGVQRVCNREPVLV